ncbi:hypothetical protein B0H65DRAFT_474643 [Neurospora tetraspora]|uniref:Uncharacterized protein n=1 Tax=Neurospora tetraspora TaxID=94610 RepID=A0AAE0J871_9PEZI|nr:hypothetical protein B0H65DRAFT_474643 [Neurospora tetraspora]
MFKIDSGLSSRPVDEEDGPPGQRASIHGRMTSVRVSAETTRPSSPGRTRHTTTPARHLLSLAGHRSHSPWQYGPGLSYGVRSCHMSLGSRTMPVFWSRHRRASWPFCASFKRCWLFACESSLQCLNAETPLRNSSGPSVIRYFLIRVVWYPAAGGWAVLVLLGIRLDTVEILLRGDLLGRDAAQHKFLQ